MVVFFFLLLLLLLLSKFTESDRVIFYNKLLQPATSQQMDPSMGSYLQILRNF